MTLTLVTTPGASNANAYNDIAAVSDYAAATIWSDAWLTIADDTDAATGLIVRGTRYFEWLAFPGQTTSPTQALQWPRVGVYLPNGLMVDPSIVPTQIKNASAHLIAYLAGFGLSVDPFTVDPTAKFEQKTVGPLSTQYVPSIGPDGLRILNTVIAPLLRPWNLLAPQGVVRLTR